MVRFEIWKKKNRMQTSENLRTSSLFCVINPSGEDSGLDELSTDGRGPHGFVKYNMRKSLDLEQEGCYLQTGKTDCLEECGFNATAKTIFIIHGWTVHMSFK